MAYLQEKPYGGYTVLKYPNLFEQFNMLESTLGMVKNEDILDFVIARKENMSHFNVFIKGYRGSASSKLQEIQRVAQKMQGEKKKMPACTAKIVQLIKAGNLTMLRDFFEKQDKGNNLQYLEILNSMQGYEDSEYQKFYKSQVKYESQDETFKLLLSDNSTLDWNPLIFAIFYQKLDILQYFCESQKVYVRNCLTTPFLIESDCGGEYEETNEERFIKEKTEIFCLILAIMVNNKQIFQYLWKQCAYLWNDVHMVLMTNFLFDSVWPDGIKIFYHSANTK
jgi:hypothetical protein